MNTAPLSDEELVSQFRNGHLHAGSILYSRYKNAIYSFCLRMLEDSDGAKDTTQETFLKMMTKIQSLEQGIAFKSWLFSVARNEVLMVVRRKKIVPMEKYDDEVNVTEPSTPLTLAIQSEIHEKIEQAIQKLKIAYRETYMLREIEGLSYEEIAQATGSTISAVKSKLFKSRVALNEILAPFI
ncbi:MAG: sigma-70 family RNA polymerase sigma factor [Ignavibacteriales bacterium]|nr:sigma-70 family RNA polymerase sigma factor [Ignavibacteriales bacterium]